MLAEPKDSNYLLVDAALYMHGRILVSIGLLTPRVPHQLLLCNTADLTANLTAEINIFNL